MGGRNDDGMVSNASEQRRKVNTTRSDDVPRIDASNSNQAHLNLAISYDDATDYEHYEFNYLYMHTM